MQKNELRGKIKDSAQQIQIPENLLPEQIKEKLTDEREKCNKKKSYHLIQTAAAVLLAVCCISVTLVTLRQTGRNLESGTQPDSAEELDAGTETKQSETGNKQENNIQQSVEAEYEGNADNEKSERNTDLERKHKDAGNLYMVADNYLEATEIIQRTLALQTDQTQQGGVQDKQFSTDSTISLADGTLSTAFKEKNYSTTNLQTTGVDEGDIVKTDGSFLYVAQENSLKIIDIRDDSLKLAAEININSDSDMKNLMEVYVDQDKLIFIIQRTNIRLDSINQDIYRKERSTGYPDVNVPATDSNTEYPQEDIILPDNDIYYMDMNSSTEICTYNIKDPAHPQLLGSYVQDGVYDTSRKIGDYIYLFTNQRIVSSGIAEESAESLLPLINGNMIEANCIYIPKSKEASNQLLISSINVNNPQDNVDNILILNNNVDIYVSSQTFYLYHEEYVNDKGMTQIAKFRMEDGKLDAVSAAGVAGSVRDPYAINEYQGQLRVLTTGWDYQVSETTNRLFVFNEKLELTGSLDGIAQGEDIYSARYLGEVAYFVTYRNIDPLFAIDLSDPTDPKILGERKLTGYSEYLHFWGENQLLGIGYETNPKSGMIEGIKLVMFDISNPSELNIMDSKVLANYNVTLLEEEQGYKTILADSQENLIGLVVVGNHKNAQKAYNLFTWDGQEFVPLLEEALGQNHNERRCRGLYVGNRFYIVNAEEVLIYDRENHYKKIDSFFIGT